MGGALILLVVGYLVSRYSTDERTVKANELRKIEYRRQQALLAEQTRAETARYLQDESMINSQGGLMGKLSNTSKIAPARDDIAPENADIIYVHSNTLNPSLSIGSLHCREDSSGLHRIRERSRLDSIEESSVHSSETNSADSDMGRQSEVCSSSSDSYE